MEPAAAAGAGYPVLAQAGLAESRVVGLAVRVYGPVGDLMGADGAEDWLGRVDLVPGGGLGGRLERRVQS